MNLRNLTLAVGLLLSLAVAATACSSPAPTATPLLPSLTPAAAPTVASGAPTGPAATSTGAAPTEVLPTPVGPTATVPTTGVTSVPPAGGTTPVPSRTPVAGTTPARNTTPSAGAACTNRATFVADVTVPDNTAVAPGQSFNKIWRLRNSGTCTWNSSYSFRFLSGEAMTTTTSVPVPNTAPGATVDILVPLTAPATVGTHRGFWELSTANRTGFGRVWVIVRVINVGAPNQRTPSAPASTGTPAAAPSPTPGGTPYP